MINIINETRFNIADRLVKNCVKAVLNFKNSKAELSIIFVESGKIRKLNKQHKGQDRVTDILSFKSYENNYLGDIIICPQYIKENSAEFTWEICHVVIHGVLHLLGVHHNNDTDYKKMHELEQEILNKIMVR